MATPTLHQFNSLPPEIRHLVWTEALEGTECLHVFHGCLQRTGVYEVDHVYCQAGSDQEVPSLTRLSPELNLRLVNQEAREVVGHRYEDLRQFKLNTSTNGRRKVLVNPVKDMFYLTTAKTYNNFFRRTSLFRQNRQIVAGLRNLALPAFEISQIPDQTTLQLFSQSVQPHYSPWLTSDIRTRLIPFMTNLQTLYLVVNHLFRVPFGVTGRRITRRPTAAPTAELVASRTQLRDLVESQTRDAYGFSDYDTFIANWQWPVLVRRERAPLPAMIPSYSSYYFPRDFGEEVELLFKEYDPHLRMVLSEVRRILAHTHPAIDVRLVVDLDSNANGEDPFMKLAEDGTMTDRGYDRHFCVGGSASDWYADISGHDPRTAKGFEDDEDTEKNGSDPDFDVGDLNLYNLSDGSGSNSDNVLLEEKAKKTKQKAKAEVVSKEGSEEDSEDSFIPDDDSEGDLTSE